MSVNTPYGFRLFIPPSVMAIESPEGNLMISQGQISAFILMVKIHVDVIASKEYVFMLWFCLSHYKKIAKHTEKMKLIKHS